MNPGYVCSQSSKGKKKTAKHKLLLKNNYSNEQNLGMVLLRRYMTPTPSCRAYPGFPVLFTGLQETSVLPEVIIREWWLVDLGWGGQQIEGMRKNHW